MDPIPLPPGRWAVGVSGGADSVALLRLTAAASPHVVHLDHQARGDDSTADAAFVAHLAARLGLAATVARLSDVDHDPLPNPSAGYRQARLALFRQVVDRHGLAGVVLAHHADDQAETVMLRLLRGGGPRALGGMAGRSTVGGLTILRPMLHTAAADLRRYLAGLGQPWREDASNASDGYLRNRLRPWLAADPAVAEAARHLAVAARRWRAWMDDHAPTLGEAFAAVDLAVPAPLARHAAGRWLAARGAAADAVSAAACDRLVAMATDAATPARQSFPGDVSVRRTGGWLTAAVVPRPAPGPRTPGPIAGTG